MGGRFFWHGNEPSCSIIWGKFLTIRARQLRLLKLSLCSFLPFFGIHFKIVWHSPTQVPKRRLHYIALPQDLDAAICRCAAETQVGHMASPRARCREHVDQCQCWTDNATAHFIVRRHGHFSGTAADRNCHQMVEETESTPKRVVRPNHKTATHKALTFPGLRPQPSESSWGLPAVWEECFNELFSGIRRSESALEGQDIPTAPMNSHIHHTWQMLSGYGWHQSFSTEMLGAKNLINLALHVLYKLYIFLSNNYQPSSLFTSLTE